MDEQQRATWIAVIVCGFLFGGIGAWAWWEKRQRREQQRAYEAIPEEERRAMEAATQKRAREFAAEQAAERFTAEYGTLRPPMICPHCHSTGTVYCKAIDRKKGVSGAKATGALLTGGISLLVVGLSRTESDTQAHCERCSATWFF